jgi:hypothetical protein
MGMSNIKITTMPATPLRSTRSYLTNKQLYALYRRRHHHHHHRRRRHHLRRHNPRRRRHYPRRHRRHNHNHHHELDHSGLFRFHSIGCLIRQHPLATDDSPAVHTGSQTPNISELKFEVL